ncbi:hypothetical protein F8R13_06190 [Hydrogenovibrio sp. JE_KL2]|nr:hypothetical protein [Hydrogenovibrio sp. JE_KL2]
MTKILKNRRYTLQTSRFRSNMSRMKSAFVLPKRSTWHLILSSMLLIASSVLLSGCQSPFSDSDEPQIDVWKTDPSCHLHQGTCSSSSGKQSVELQITPNSPIPVAHLLTAQLTLKGFKKSPQNVQIDIVGTNMYMGYNRTTLIPVAGFPNVYRGKIMLAFCTNDKMDWEISALITQNDKHIIKVPFLLTTQSH